MPNQKLTRPQSNAVAALKAGPVPYEDFRDAHDPRTVNNLVKKGIIRLEAGSYQLADAQAKAA